MKKLFLLLSLCAGLALATAPVAMFTGCANTTQQTTYKTLNVVGHAATDAFDAYLLLVVKDQVEKASLPRVAVAYNAFQAAFGMAVDAAQGNKEATAPANLIALSTALVTAIAEAKGH